MNQPKDWTAGKIATVLLPAFLLTLTGCVGYVEEPRPVAYVPPAQVYAEPVVTVQDDYVYFPEYEVYYSSSRRLYTYREGGSWITRPTPRIGVNVLFATPSVRMDFHDSPSRHHDTVVRQYPRHGAPHGQEHNQGNNDHDNGHGR